MAYEVIKPILELNKGVAIFNTTPNGKNHASELREIAENSKDWFFEKLTVNDTKLLNAEDIERIEDEGMSKEMIQQEFYCSEEAGVLGSIYADRIEKIRENGQICKNIYDPNLDVHTAWDIGYSDDTAICFFQVHGKEVRIIDSYSNYNMTVPEYISILKEKPYRYGTHFFPWDANIKSVGSRQSYIDIAKEYGIGNYKILENMNVQLGIQNARNLLKNCYFNEDTTKELIKALINYHRKYDEKRKRFANDPDHDWTSHYSDSFRYVCMAINMLTNRVEKDYTESAKKFIRFDAERKPIDENLGIKANDYENYQRSAQQFLKTQ
jgi:predicted kinase